MKAALRTLFAARAVVTLGAILLFPPTLQGLQKNREFYYRSYPLLARTFPTPARPDPNVVVVGLDDATLDDARLPHWGPAVLRRRAHARVVEELAAGGARVIGFDMAFIDPSEDDDRFRQALDRAPATVLVVEARPRSLPAEGDRFLEPTAALAGAASVRLASPLVRQVAATGEVLGVEMEQLRPDGRALNAFAFECYKAFARRDDLSASFAYSTVGSNNVMAIRRWPQPPAAEAFTTVSYRDVWDGSWKERRPDLFRGKIVLIGSISTLGRADVLKTPVGALHGVLVHACALQTLTNADWVDDQAVATWVLTLLAAAVATLATYRLRPLAAGGGVLGVALLCMALSVLLYRWRIWVSPVQPVLATLLFGAAGLGSGHALSRRMLERYAGEEAARQLSTHGRVESRAQRATVFFADLRGYTTLSEQLSPAELMEVLNDHYRWMDGIVEKHGGRVDKHIGDAMMAVFETGRRGDNPAERAIRAAEAMVSTAGARRGRSSELRFGIGIHTGEIFTGALGGSRREEYGSVGDTVNVAARLESATRDLGVALLVSAETTHEAGMADRLKPLPPVVLKGKTEPVPVYTLRE